MQMLGTFPEDDFEIRLQTGSARGAKANCAVEFARRLGFHPNPRQAEVLASGAKRGILNCTRQWGKSTVTAIKALHHAYPVMG